MSYLLQVLWSSSLCSSLPHLPNAYNDDTELIGSFCYQGDNRIGWLVGISDKLENHFGRGVAMENPLSIIHPLRAWEAGGENKVEVDLCAYLSSKL